MQDPFVELRGVSYPVHQANVRLGLNSGPLLYLRLGQGESPDLWHCIDLATKETRGVFSWQNDSLEFIIIGFNKSPALEVVGLVLQLDLVHWFNTLPSTGSQNVDYLVYQRQTSGDGWNFLNNVLGRKFTSPRQLDPFDQLFPPGSCLWRSVLFDNFRFLNHAIALLSRRNPSIKGWSAFESDEEPLRLIIFEEDAAVELDCKWATTSHFLPNRYAGDLWSTQPCVLHRRITLQDNCQMRLIKHLVSCGLQRFYDGFLRTEDEDNVKLLLLPGTIKIGEKVLFCQTITYEFQLYNQESQQYCDPQEATLIIETSLPDREIGGNAILPLRLVGNFQDWRMDGEEDPPVEINIEPDSQDNWRIMSEADPMSESDSPLHSHILSPTSSRENFSGIYITHQKGDRMIMEMKPCSIPLALGSLQKYQEKLEAVDISIGGDKLAISVSPHSTDLQESHGILFDKTGITGKAEKTIIFEADQSVSFMKENILVESDKINIKKDTQIDGNLDVGSI